MSDILVRDSDGRVLDWGDHIADTGTFLVVTRGASTKNVAKGGIAGSATLVTGVILPADLATRLYTYSAGAFTDAGAVERPPTTPLIIDRDALLSAMRAVDQAAFVGAITDARLSYFFGRIAAVDSYHVDAPELQLGLSLMVALGHWTQAQSDSFLSSWPTT